jgi:23S rRNA (guanosine2251-2'-O)-methyltransferase
VKEFLYGRHAVEEALLANRRDIFSISISDRAKLPTQSRLKRLAGERKIPLNPIPKNRLDRLVGQANHQGVVAEVSSFPYCEIDEILTGESAESNPIILLLDCVQDPQNLGALIRSAEAVGVAGIVLPKNRAVNVTPAVVNASAGAVEHLRVALVTNLARTMASLKKEGFWIVGLEAQPEAQRYDQVDLNVPIGLVVGSEGRGLGRLIRERCDYLVKLPMRGHISSLNASIAGSVVLYEAWRQRNITAEAE